jgi:hypothetical protein
MILKPTNGNGRKLIWKIVEIVLIAVGAYVIASWRAGQQTSRVSHGVCIAQIANIKIIGTLIKSDLDIAIALSDRRNVGLRPIPDTIIFNLTDALSTLPDPVAC